MALLLQYKEKVVLTEKNIFDLPETKVYYDFRPQTCVQTSASVLTRKTIRCLSNGPTVTKEWALIRVKTSA